MTKSTSGISNHHLFAFAECLAAPPQLVMIPWVLGQRYPSGLLSASQDIPWPPQGDQILHCPSTVFSLALTQDLCGWALVVCC